MQTTFSNNTKQLDSYSLLIVSKYLKKKWDFINVVCVCKKFKETTEKFRFNPIYVTNNKLFPKMQTQYLRRRSEKKIEGIEHYEIWYKVFYNEYLKMKEDNIKCHYVIFTAGHKRKYGSNIPQDVTMLSEKCYSKSTSKSIVIPNTIISIGNSCFYRNLDLTKLVLPKYLKCIKHDCFSCCISLKNIELPQTLEAIEKNSFYFCSSLRHIDFPNSLTFLGNDCFSYCKFESVLLPTSIKFIGLNCFSHITELTSIKLQSNETNAKFKVYYTDSKFFKQFGINCKNILLTQTYVKTIQNEIIQQNNILKEFVIPNCVIEIADHAFRYQSTIQSIIIPTTVTSIGNNCFSYCSSLTSLTIPNSIKYIGFNSFENCTSLKTISIPSTLTVFNKSNIRKSHYLKKVQFVVN
ncbi:hypothetical protein QTN25_004027 [Entamoeba marina]